jgi:hypothetical protein
MTSGEHAALYGNPNLTLVIPCVSGLINTILIQSNTSFIIVKIHTYHQGNMFQLQGAIIRPLYKNRFLSGFWCTIGIPIVYITGYCCIQYSILVTNEVKMENNGVFYN